MNIRFQLGTVNLEEEPGRVLKTRIIAAHDQALQRIQPYLTLRQARLLDQAVIVSFSERMRSCAGRAIGGQEIKLNYRLLRQNPTELIPTYLHELAHILAYRLYQARGHDPHWQELMAWIGQSPQRTHQMDVSHLKYQQRRYRYLCHCSEHFISAHRHTKVCRGVTYKCRHCYGVLRAVS
ncbi:SprT-like domain-containing protein [Synechococcus sp. PCC 6312]|uniref:SprT family zinc-dependent metalloprotease n=1 Tax=Synechococcus sp. (strain ATCC 27167 / PCC 6312) TaxID=195253 RepID=UPI00029EFAD3|nr:SprT-like domain-containing protein [Synechococcus sp. PCC 6312]AFY62413.1 hypothetical protein Syn6312_3384 [Synechococcus sp. PCC 6312]